jgi:hypothetical protein
VRHLYDHQRRSRPLSRDDHRHQFGIISSSDSVFERARKRSLSPIIIGTNRSLLHKLLTEAQSYVAKRFKVDLDIQPKGRTVNAKSLDVVWDHLSAILDERTVVILELGGCCSHWTVLYDVKPQTMLLLDSGYRRTLTRSHCTLGPSKTHYRLKLPAAIAISRVRPT